MQLYMGVHRRQVLWTGAPYMCGRGEYNPQLSHIPYIYSIDALTRLVFGRATGTALSTDSGTVSCYTPKDASR